MKRAKPIAYLLVVAIVLAPAGLRMAFWPTHQLKPVDPQMASAGKVLFLHEWKPNDPLSPNGDGLGPVFNARSCVECHKQGGIGGGGELKHNVTTFMAKTNEAGGKVRQGVVHAHATKEKYQENLSHVHSSLPAISRPSLNQILPEFVVRTNFQVAQPEVRNPQALAIPHNVHLAQRNTPALFGARLIDAIPDRIIVAHERAQRLHWEMTPTDTVTVPVGRAFRLQDGRVGKFGWKAQSASLIDFVEAACANELGLGNPNQAQPAPLGAPDYKPRGLDLTSQQCAEIASFIESLPAPKLRLPADIRAQQQVHNGNRVFHSVGCAACHTPSIGSVEGIYSDLLLHRMGQDLIGGGGYNSPPVEENESPGASPLPDEWRTPPLWGIADSAPYMHDGRAATLEQAILMHGGQGERSRQRFDRLAQSERNDLMTFLKSLRAP